MIDWFRYDRATTVVHAQDDFSQFRKWHQGLFDAAEQQQGGDGGSVEGTKPTAAFGLNTSAFSLSSVPGADRDRGYNWRETAPPKQASPLRPASPSKLDPAAVSAMDACFEDDIETHIAKAASVVAKPLRPSSPSMQLWSISLSPASEAVQEHASLAPAAAQSSHSLAPASTQSSHALAPASHSTIPDSESLPPTPPRHTPSPNLPEPGPVATNTTDKRGTALYLRSASLDRAIGRQQHTVNLLPLDGRDSADLFLPRTYSHSPQQYQHQHDPPLSTSYEEDRRVYDALPNYPDSIPTFESPPRPMGSEKPQYMDTEEEAFPSLGQLSSTAVDPIPPEEEDMETYLSWLNSQEPSASVQHQPQQLLSTVVSPTAAPVAAITTSSQKMLPQQRQEKQKKQQQPLQTTPVRRNSDPIIASKTASNSSNIP